MFRSISLLILLVAPQLACASEFLGGTPFFRGGVSTGYYYDESDESAPDIRDHIEGGAFSYNVGLGGGMVWDRFDVDLGFELYRIEDIKRDYTETDIDTSTGEQTTSSGTLEGYPISRTDLALVVRYAALDWLSPFIGARYSLRGDNNFFSSEYDKEYGPFFGVAFSTGSVLRATPLTLSLAYNLNRRTAESEDFQQSFSFNGVSGRLRMNFGNTPHAVELRFQSFSGGRTFADGTDRIDRKTAFAYVGYVFALPM